MKKKKIIIEKDPLKIAAMKKHLTTKRKVKGKKKFSVKRELFCQYYVSKDFFGDGVEAYAHAYDIDLTKQSGKNTCRVNAYNLLTNTVILSRIREIQRHANLNDEFVDRETGFVIQQRGDLNAKMRGIAEYNKISKRIEDKKIEVNFFTTLDELDKKAISSRTIEGEVDEGDKPPIPSTR